MLNGQYTVVLDFGSDRFTGDDRWLEIRARPGNRSGGYNIVSDRQELTAVPYALGLRPGAIISGTANMALRLYNGIGDGLQVENGYYGVNVFHADYDGFRVGWAENDGLSVVSATNGVYVYQAEGDGLKVCHTGAPPEPEVCSDDPNSNGLEIEDADADGVHVTEAGDDGLYVGSAGNNGVNVIAATNNGLSINSTGGFGIHVSSANVDGLYVGTAGNFGLNVDGNELAGVFRGPIQVDGGCNNCLLTTFGLNTGDSLLQPGDIVSLKGMASSPVDSAPALLNVALASSGEPLVGVVQGWAELVAVENPRPGESPQRLIPREGTAETGDYVTIIIYGLAQVKAADNPILPGERVAVDEQGQVRALQTAEVNGIQIAESAHTIDMALAEPTADGLVWVLVNPQ